jgi:hypothetical protein
MTNQVFFVPIFVSIEGWANQFIDGYDLELAGTLVDLNVNHCLYSWKDTIISLWICSIRNIIYFTNFYIHNFHTLEGTAFVFVAIGNAICAVVAIGNAMGNILFESCCRCCWSSTIYTIYGVDACK